MANRPMVKLNVDPKHDVAYLTLSEEDPVATVEHSDDILVDLDALNMVVGIEFLSMGTGIPLTDLVTRFHIPTEVVAAINMLLPSIETRMQITSGTDPVTSAHTSQLPRALSTN